MFKSTTVVGNGHGLNELINRLLIVGAGSLGASHNQWELYPGPLGLYARHCDDAQMYHMDNVQDFYNDFVRQDVDPDGNFRDLNNIQKFKSMFQQEYTQRYGEPIHYLSYYINTVDIAPVLDYLESHTQTTAVTAYMDMCNPMLREHFLMMEFSPGAAEDLDYSQELTIMKMCEALEGRQQRQQDLLEQYADDPRVVVADLSKIFDKDFSDLMPLFQEEDVNINGMEQVIDTYKFTNHASTHPLMEHVRNLSWEEVLAFSNLDTTDET